MGIQDRDYWQDWKRRREGEGGYIKPFPGRGSVPPTRPKSAADMSDEALQRAVSQKYQQSPDRPPDGYLIAFVLLTFVVTAIGFFVYKVATTLF